MIGTKERWIAMIGCFAAGTVAFGAKASGPVLAIWTLTVLALTVLWRSDRTVSFKDFARPTEPVVRFLLLAGFAMASAAWAHNPRAAVDAGATLGAAILAGHVLDRGLNRLPPAGATLVSGWFVIGLAGGGLLLLFEFLSNFALMQWIMTSVPGLKPDRNMLIADAGEHRLVVDRAMGNWSVAIFNFMAWPAVLAVATIVRGPARWIAAGLLLCLVAVVTLISDHQTSQLALFVSLAIFAAASYAPQATRRLALSVCLLLILVTLPVAYGVNRVAHLQEASWAQFSLKERFRIWSNAAEHYVQAPVLGIGANNTTIIETSNAPPRANPQDVRPKHHPHNMILQIWLELGAAGAALLALACVSVFRAFDRVPPRVMPYVLATGATVAIQVSATWSLWSTWFLCAVALTMSFLCLAVRAAREAERPDAQTFADVWLPPAISAKLRSWARV